MKERRAGRPIKERDWEALERNREKMMGCLIRNLNEAAVADEALRKAEQQEQKAQQ